MTNEPANQSDILTETPPAQDDPSWLEVFTPWRLAGLIAIVLFALYPGVILGTHSFFFRDFGVFTYPVAFYSHESFWRGQVPLWNPLDNCGVPFLAQWNTSVCYPLSLIYMVLPLPWSLNYFCLGHLMLGGVGMYWLAYRWTQNRLAASIAGLVFALNGLMLNCLMWTSNLAAFSWQPLVVLWVEQAWRQGGKHRLALAVLAGTMQMLAGSPEIVVFTWTILAVLWLLQAWKKEIHFGRAFGRFATVVGLIAGLSAIQLLPFFDLLNHSDRNSSFFTAERSPMPVWGWANFVVPFFHCEKITFGTFLQPGQVWTSSYYVGVGTLALAALAVWQLRRRPVICGLAGVTLAGLLLALGNNGYLYSWLKHIVPWIGFARYPIKFVSIPVFTIPLLAACGLNALQNATAQNLKRNERFLFLAAAFLVLTVIFILATARWWIEPGFDWRVTWRSGAFRIIFLIALVGTLSALVRVPSSRLRSLVGLAVLAAIGFDLVTVGTQLNPTVVKKAFGPLQLNMTSLPKYGESRAMLSQQVASYLFFARTPDPLYYYVGLRGALFENCNMPENVPKVDGFCSLHLKDESDITEVLYGTYMDNAPTDTPPTPLLDFLGVSQLSATNTIFAWRERKSFMPLATAGQRPIFASDAETIKMLQSTNFDPRHTVYLPLSARSKMTVTNASAAKIIFQQYGAQSAQLKVEAPTPALVVIAQAYYHDWHAFVDGKPVPLLRANHAFQALEVPAGQHEIILRYEDWMFRLGAMISGLTLLVCLAGLSVKPKQ